MMPFMKRTKKLLIITTALMLFCLSSNAQSDKFKRLSKGEKNPFDDAVTMEYKTYKDVRRKLNSADSVVNSLQKQIHLQRQSFMEAEEKIGKAFDNHEKVVQMMAESIKRKDALLSKMQSEYEELINEMNNKRFYEKPAFWFGVGIIGGALITR